MTVIFVVTGGRDGEEKKIKEGIEMNQPKSATREGQAEGRTGGKTYGKREERANGPTVRWTEPGNDSIERRRDLRKQGQKLEQKR